MPMANRISSTVLEGVNYISVGAGLSDEDVRQFEQNLPQWANLPVELHVLDMKNLSGVPERFFKAINNFAGLLSLRHTNLISINVSDVLFGEITRHGLAHVFNRVESVTSALTQKKRELSETELKRLLFKYLIRAAHLALEVTCNSTVTCDENYMSNPARVPYEKIDLISVIDVRGEFLNAQFRLCASSDVLTELAKAMLSLPVVEPEMVESMAQELLNLIYGNAKSNLNENESFRLPPAIPKLYRRPDFKQIKRSTPPQLTVLPLVTPLGSFYVEVDFGAA